MEPNQQSVQNNQQLRLYIYGNRQADQFWLPDAQSYSRRPICLSELEKMQEMNCDEDEENQRQSQVQKTNIIINPLFGKKIFRIACGGLHSVVLTTEGEVFTFGCNDEGALGRKGIESMPAKVDLEDPVDLISAGDNHSLFANSRNGAVYFTGNYNYLRGEKMASSVFKPIRIYTTEINYKLRNKPIQKVASGENHSCILVDGHVFCRGEPESFTIGRRISARHKVDNSLTFNGVNLSNIVDVECGGYHTIAKIKHKGQLQYYAWGKNDKGQLGVGSYKDQNYPVEIEKLAGEDIVEMAAGTSFSLFLSSKGDLFGCGSNEYGNLGLGQNYSYQPSEESEEDQKKEKQQSKPDLLIKQPHIGNSTEKGTIPLSNGVEPSPQQPNEQKPDQAKMLEQKPNEHENSEMKAGSDMLQKFVQLRLDANSQINQQEQQRIKLLQEQLYNKKVADTYIKSIRKIDMPQPVTHIRAGSHFSMAWNQSQLYSWGMGIGYVLLNGEEEDEYTPFQVKNKIINNQQIYDLAAGGQHVMYLSYAGQATPEVQPDNKIWQQLSTYKKLPRRRV